MKKLAYVMSPYTHADEDVMNLRAHLAACAVSKLMMLERYNEYALFSPIIHYHAVAIRNCSLPRDIEYWWETNLPYLTAAALGIVLRLPGWDDSKGIAAELAWFSANEIPVHFTM